MDTLDYSGTGLNSGSKVVFAAYGEKTRELATEVPTFISEKTGLKTGLCIPGVVAIEGKPFTSYPEAAKEMEQLSKQLSGIETTNTPILIYCDDANFTSENLNNYLWVAYTRCNPSHDIYGVDAITTFKHWGCKGPLIIDARIKPHHAPPVEKDPNVEKRIDRLFAKGGSLFGKF